MKATITALGRLVIQSETELEDFAFKMWQQESLTKTNPPENTEQYFTISINDIEFRLKYNIADETKD